MNTDAILISSDAFLISELNTQ